MENKIIIIGAGISGLSCAYHLEAAKERGYLLLEAKDKAGGLCGSYTQNGFTFDYSGHLLHIGTKAGLKLTQKLLGKNAALLKRKAFVHLCGAEQPFPLQNNLYGLPEDIIKECVQGALEAYKNKNGKDLHLFKNWALALYGAPLCKYFMFPYNQKLWRTDLNKLTSAWCGKFVPSCTLEDIIKGAYSRRKKDFGYNAHFFYPKTGGCAALCEGLQKKVTNLRLNHAVEEIDLKNKTLKAAGQVLPWQKIVNTMPLKELGAKIKNLPPAIKKDFETLKHNSVYALNIGFSGKTKDGHWYYFAEDKYPFHRVGVQSAFSPDMAPKGASSLYVEFAFEPSQKPNFKELEAKALPLLKELGFMEKDAKIMAKSWVEIPCAYPIYDTKYEAALKNIIDFMAGQNIYLLGRYGAWEYSFMEKSLLDGMELAFKLTGAR